MKQYSTFLFDADGTLIDTTELIVECFRYTLPRFGISIPDDAFVVSHIGIPFRLQLHHYSPTLTKSLEDEICAFYKEYQLQVFTDYLRLCPGTMETLEELKNMGRNLAVVTSRSRETLDLFLKHAGIFTFFSFTVTPDDVTKPKPDPEPTLYALKRFNSSPEETLFVGDAIYDAMSAHDAGVDFAYVNWSHSPVKNFTDISWKLDTMTQLLQD